MSLVHCPPDDPDCGHPLVEEYVSADGATLWWCPSCEGNWTRDPLEGRRCLLCGQADHTAFDHCTVCGGHYCGHQTGEQALVDWDLN